VGEVREDPTGDHVPQFLKRGGGAAKIRRAAISIPSAKGSSSRSTGTWESGKATEKPWAGGRNSAGSGGRELDKHRGL